MDADTRRTYSALALALVRLREQLGEVRREAELNPDLRRLERGLVTLLGQLEILPLDLHVLETMWLNRDVSDDYTMTAVMGLSDDELAAAFDRLGMWKLSAADEPPA